MRYVQLPCSRSLHCNRGAMESFVPKPNLFPKRGSKLCSSCGSSNGNRAYACKACHRRFYSDPPAKERTKQWCDVSCMTSDGRRVQDKLYSVRVRNRGPDYRTLVTAEATGSWKCYYESCRTAEETRLRSTPGTDSYCEHISRVKQELRASPQPDDVESTHLELNPRLLDEMPFPATVRENLQRMNSRGANLIQRVSEESFLVRNPEMTQAHPLGLLHVRFSKNKTPSSAPPTFFCPCTVFKRFSSAQSGGAPTTPRISKRCLHFYLCLWAFASNEKLSQEYSCFRLSQQFETGSQGKNPVSYILHCYSLKCMHYLLYTHTHAHTHTSLHASELMEIDTQCQPSLPKSTEGISIIV